VEFATALNVRSQEIIVMSCPPVHIVTRRKVEIPVLDRFLDSTHLSGMKSQLIRALEM
jgi:hypothetical protein